MLDTIAMLRRHAEAETNAWMSNPGNAESPDRRKEDHPSWIAADEIERLRAVLTEIATLGVTGGAAANLAQRTLDNQQSGKQKMPPVPPPTLTSQ